MKQTGKFQQQTSVW